MYILEVIPIAKGLPFDSMTYLHNNSVSIGSIANIDINGRKVKAIVISANSAIEGKANIRSSNYKLKKIDSISASTYKFGKSFINSLLSTAHYFLITPSKLLSYLTPSDFINFILDSDINLIHNQNQTHYTEDSYKTNSQDTQSNKIKFIYYPTIEEVNSQYEKVKDANTFKLHSEIASIQKNKIFKALLQNKKINTEKGKNKITAKNKITIISTPNIIPSIISDIVNKENIEIEIENSDSLHYYHPHFDINTLGIISTNFKDNELKFNLNNKTLDLTNINFVDMSEDQNIYNKDFLFSRQALSKIADAQSSKTKLIIYTPRRGLAPTSACDDCGTLVACGNCQSPLVLHEKNNQRVYICHKCEKRNIKFEIVIPRDKEILCNNCGSWRISLRGISTGSLKENLFKYNLPLFVTDKDNTNSKLKINKVIKDWQQSNKGILITNDSSLPSLSSADLTDNITVIVSSMDGLLSMPEYLTNQKILETLSTLNKISNHNLIVQSRNIKNTIFEFIQDSKVDEFLKLEKITRTMAELPPEYVIVKFFYNSNYNKDTKSYTDYMSQELKDRLTNFLSPHKIYWYKSYAHIFIKSSEYTPDVQNKIYIALQTLNPLINPSSLHSN